MEHRHTETLLYLKYVKGKDMVVSFCNPNPNPNPNQNVKYDKTVALHMLTMIEPYLSLSHISVCRCSIIRGQIREKSVVSSEISN